MPRNHPHTAPGFLLLAATMLLGVSLRAGAQQNPGRDARQELHRVNSRLRGVTNLRMAMEVAYYQSSGSALPDEQMRVRCLKRGTDFLVEYEGRVTQLRVGDYVLVVDHEDRSILLDRPSQYAQFGAGSGGFGTTPSLLDSLLNVQGAQVQWNPGPQDGQGILVFTYPRTGQIQKTEVEYDLQRYVVTKVRLEYSPIQTRWANGTVAEVTPVVVLRYTQFDLDAAISASEMNLSRFIQQQGGGYRPAAEFAQYRFTNRTSTP